MCVVLNSTSDPLRSVATPLRLPYTSKSRRCQNKRSISGAHCGRSCGWCAAQWTGSSRVRSKAAWTNRATVAVVATLASSRCKLQPSVCGHSDPRAHARVGLCSPQRVASPWSSKVIRKPRAHGVSDVYTASFSLLFRRLSSTSRLFRRRGRLRHLCARTLHALPFVRNLHLPVILPRCLTLTVAPPPLTLRNGLRPYVSKCLRKKTGMRGCTNPHVPSLRARERAKTQWKSWLSTTLLMRPPRGSRAV